MTLLNCPAVEVKARGSLLGLLFDKQEKNTQILFKRGGTMRERFIRLFILLVFGFAGTLYGQTPSETLADFDQAEETVFALKGTGDYVEAQKKLTDAFVHLTRTMTSGPEELKPELTARGECYLEMLYSLAQTTARYAALDEALDQVSIESPILENLKSHIQLKLNLHKGDLNKARDMKAKLGFIDAWHLIGPFDNERGGGFDTAYDPELVIDLEGAYPGKERQVRWRMNPCESLTGFVNLDAIFNPYDQCLAYALIFISSDKAQDACLRLSSDEAVKVFLNKKEIYSLKARRMIHFGQDVIALPLEAGVNALMLKVCDQTGPWGFSARLTSSSGTALQGAQVVDAPEAFTLPEGAEARTGGKPDAGAIQYFEKRAGEGDARAHLYLGMLHHFREFKGEDEGLATLHLNEFLELNPEHLLANDLYAHSVLRRFEIAAEKDDNEWRSRLEKIVELNPKHVESLVRLGQYYTTSLNIPDKALAYAKAAYEANPDYLPATYLFADIYDQIDMKARGKKAIIDLSHDNKNLVYPGLLNRLAHIAKQERRTEDAHELWQSVLKIDFMSDEARGSLLDLALGSGKIEEARRILQENLEINPYHVPTLKKLANLARGDDDPEKALSILQRALDIIPEDDDTLKRMGDIHIAMGKKEKAISSYNQALDINPKAKDLRRYVEFLSEDERPFEDDFKVDVLALVATHPPGKNEDNESHEYLLLQDVIKVNPDGTSAHYHHRVVRVLNQQGAKRFNYFYTFYTPGEQKCRILTARVIHPDGSIEEAKIDNIDMSSTMKNMDRIPAYVDLPPMKPGDLVDVEFRTDDLKQSFFGDYFGHRHLFQKPDLKAVYDSRFTLILPKEREFFFNQRNLDFKPDITADPESGDEIRTWTLSNIAKIDTERSMPGPFEVAPCVEVTTYKNWESFGRWWWNLVEKQIDVTDEMKAKVAELTEGKNTEREKIKAIYNFVVSDIRYSDAWEFGVHGFKPYRSSAIFTRRFGDCKDKSILIKAMLREAGIEANLVLIHADPSRSREDLTLPMVAHFNHVISFVPEIDGEKADLFLDGTAQFHPMEALPDMDRGATVYVVQEGQGAIMTIPHVEPLANTHIKSFDVTLNIDGSADILLEVQSRGTFEAMTRQRFLNPGKRQDELEKSLGSIFGNAAISDLECTDVEDLDTVVGYTAKVRVEDLLLKSGTNNQLKSVFFSTQAGQAASEDERGFDLLLGAPYTLSTAIVYRLPETLAAQTLPEGVELENDFAAYSLTYTRVDASAIRINRDFTLKAPRVAAQDYEEFRDLCREAERAEEKLIQISKVQ